MCWLALWWRRDRPSLPRLSHPIWFYALYVAALAPFATNWRWVMAGDNLSWPVGGLWVSEHGIGRSPLSANGADNFGYMQMLVHDIFMFVVSPTIFWHRIGKIFVGLAALMGVYSFFARLVAPAFALLVAATAATCSVWIVYTYASVPFLDGLAFGYASLAVALWIRRDPDSLQAWLTLGVMSGLMLFFTPNGWFLALCAWMSLVPLLLRRPARFGHAVVAGITGLLIGCPMFIQWSQGKGGQLFSLVENPGWTAQKVWSFLVQAATIPFSSPIQGAGAFGPQLPIGFRWLFIPGILVTPILARYFPGARAVLVLYLVNVVILAFAQGPYADVSVKRALVLIPLATYFVFVPAHRFLRSYAVVLPIIALWASFGIYDIAQRMQPGRTGYTFLDGIVEAHQRFDDAPVCIYLSRDFWPEVWKPGEPLDRLYGLSPHLIQVDNLHDPRCAKTLCYVPALSDEDKRVDLKALGYEEIPMLNSVELHCGRRPT
ncbi:MAG: hypothetical protein HY270_22575 [Deltaproteobacteria bacterium]|nr:hypothetical protein [Deltaproteobacteria bacterium]